MFKIVSKGARQQSRLVIQLSAAQSLSAPSRASSGVDESMSQKST